MSIPSGAARVTLYGTAQSGNEIWATSFWINMTTPVPSDAIATTVAAALYALATSSGFTDALKACIGDDCTIEGLGFYQYTGGTTATYVGHSASVIYGTGTSLNALQLSRVATLRTALSGRRYRGRMYLPHTGLLPGSAHLWDASASTTCIDKLALWFTDINAAHSTYGDVVVMSSAGSAVTNVTEVTSDQRPDVQRRRANSQALGTVHTVSV